MGERTVDEQDGKERRDAARGSRHPDQSDGGRDACRGEGGPTLPCIWSRYRPADKRLHRTWPTGQPRYNPGMPKELKEIIRDAAALPESDRATLAGVLIESLDGKSDDDVERAWTAEIERRVAQIDAGEVELIPWEQVREELFGR